MTFEINKQLVEKFANIFTNQIKKSEAAYKEFYSPSTELLPNAFTGENIKVNAVYSSDREHILIAFYKSENYQYNYLTTNGNVFDVYDFLNLWGQNSGIRVENSINVNIRSCFFGSGRPIDLYGSTDMVLEDLKMAVPFPRNLIINLEFALVFSKDIFQKKFESIKAYANQVALNYINFFQENGKKFEPGSEDSIKRNEELFKLKKQMEEYFFENKFRETKIDNFIGENSIILKYGLGLINCISPMVLKDLHSQYNQDLKPDLVGFNPIEEQWHIVDYKLPWKKLIRGEGTVRASVTSDLTQLHSQLKTYREYFLDHAQREYVNTYYSIEMKKHPPAIGVIGTVTESERDDFNEMRQEYHGWFKIMSYDELYKKVCEYIDVVTKIN